MKQYTKMKDSGIEWIGEIPEEWYLDKIKYHYTENIVHRNLHSKKLGCQIRYLRKINYTQVATKIDPLLAEFMQGRRGNISQRHYFLPMMSQNKKKWIKLWNKVLVNF